MPTLIDWTQGTHGEWTQSAPETKWKTLEESAAILKAIFPNYPQLGRSYRSYDGQGQST